jgi:hypothetical protein
VGSCFARDGGRLDRGDDRLHGEALRGRMRQADRMIGCTCASRSMLLKARSSARRHPRPSALGLRQEDGNYHPDCRAGAFFNSLLCQRQLVLARSGAEARKRHFEAAQPVFAAHGRGGLTLDGIQKCLNLGLKRLDKRYIETVTHE